MTKDNNQGNVGRPMAPGGLRPGTRGIVSRIGVNGLLYRRLLDLGIVEGTEIEARFANPSGDPIVFRVRGADIALRKSDASLVEVVVGATPAACRETGTDEACGMTHRACAFWE